MATNFDDKLFDDSTTYKEVSKYDDSLFEDIPEEDTSFIPESLKAGAAGAAESATFGFAPEIGAGVQSLFGDKSYKEYEAENEAAFRKLEQENSKSFLAGELLGGVAQGALTGGLGTAAKVAQGVGKAAPLIGRLALTGAATGAASGLGYSKESAINALSGDTEAQKELGKDIAIGAGTGAIGNVAMPYVAKGAGEVLKAGGKAASSLGNKAINKIKFLEDMSDTYNLMKSGKEVSGKAAKEGLFQDVEKISKDIVKGGTSQVKESSKEMGDILKTIEKSDDARQVVAYLKDNIDNKNILPDDAAKLKNLIEQYENRMTKETVESGKDLTRKALEKDIRIEEAAAPMMGEKVSFPDIKETDDAFIALRKRTNQEGVEDVSTLTKQMLPDKITKETITKIKDMDAQEAYNLYKSLRDLDLSGKLEETGGKAAKEYMNLIGEFISEKLGTAKSAAFAESKGTMKKAFQARNILPALDEQGSKLGQDVDLKLQRLLLSGNDSTPVELKRAFGYLEDKFVSPELKESAFEIAKRARLNKQAEGTSILNPIIPIIPVPSGKALSIRGAEAFGAVAKSKIAQTPKEFTKYMLNTSESQLMNMASRLPKVFADSITTALKDSTKKDRLMWAISQQPAFREAVNRLTDSEETVNLEPLDVNIDN